MKLHDDFLLACRDDRGLVKVFCLKERALLYSFEGVRTIDYSKHNQTLYAQTNEGSIHGYPLQLRKDFFEESFSNNNLKFLVHKHFLETNEKACVKHIE